MTEAETRRSGATGAVAGLCPVTEANLGDGIFNGPGFIAGRRPLSASAPIRMFGSALAGELRQLEYAQRLGRRRATSWRGSRAARPDARSTMPRSPPVRAALGREVGLAVGASADIVSLAPADAGAAERTGDQILDGWIFAGGFKVETVWRAGALVVREGRHVRREEIVREYGRAMRRVMSA